MPTRYNAAPTRDIAAVRQIADGGDRELVLLQRGLIPSWSKDPTMGARMINARAETVVDKPAFRAPFRRRRCLIPADGVYEWQKVDGQKQPFYIHSQDAGQGFAFAGLRDHWEGGDGGMIESRTILTTAANDLVRPPPRPDAGDPGSRRLRSLA